jgi:hypothetical protein
MARRKKDDKALLIFGGAGLGLAALMMGKKKAPPAPMPGPTPEAMVGNPLEELAEQFNDVFAENNEDGNATDPQGMAEAVAKGLDAKLVLKSSGDTFGRGQRGAFFNPFKKITSERNVSQQLPMVVDAALSVGLAAEVQAQRQDKFHEDEVEKLKVSWWQKPVYAVGEGLGLFQVAGPSGGEVPWEVTYQNLITFMKTLKAEALENAANANESANENGQEPNVFAQVQGEEAIQNHDYWMSYALS